MRKTNSAILAAVHATARGLHQAGTMNQVTLREFNRLCQQPATPAAAKPSNTAKPDCRAGR